MVIFHKEVHIKLWLSEAWHMNIYHNHVYLINYRLVNVVNKYKLFLLEIIFLLSAHAVVYYSHLWNIINLLSAQNIQRVDSGMAPLWRATKLQALQEHELYNIDQWGIYSMLV
jgi:hypothetical protein